MSQFLPALNPFPFHSRKLPPNHRAMKKILIVILTEEVWHPHFTQTHQCPPSQPFCGLASDISRVSGPHGGVLLPGEGRGVCLPTPAAHLRREQQSHVHALNYTTLIRQRHCELTEMGRGWFLVSQSVTSSLSLWLLLKLTGGNRDQTKENAHRNTFPGRGALRRCQSSKNTCTRAHTRSRAMFSRGRAPNTDTLLLVLWGRAGTGATRSWVQILLCLLFAESPRARLDLLQPPNPQP